MLATQKDAARWVVIICHPAKRARMPWRGWDPMAIAYRSASYLRKGSCLSPHVCGRPPKRRCAIFLGQYRPPRNYVLHVVSLKFVIYPIWGDATDPSTRPYWLWAAHEGFILGFLASPPCETWSITWGKQLDNPKAKDKHMPRILRTEERLWGLPSLALKELVQIITSYCLLTFSILMARTMIQTGGIWIVEHPAEPKEDDAASFWKLHPSCWRFWAPRGSPGEDLHKVSLERILWSPPTP